LLAQLPGLSDTRKAERVSRHILAQLVCLGTHTITGILSTSGRQFHDWSADYRMYGCDRIDSQDLFGAVRNRLCRQDEGPLVTAVDDTRLRKTGKRISGVRYTRDPMGPPFHVNLIAAQRFLQTSMAARGSGGRARMIPVDWCHAPLPKKPHPSAPQQQWDQYHTLCTLGRISRVAMQRIHHLRQWLDENHARSRRLWTVVDGTFTNRTVLQNLPENTTLVGRVRSDAKFHHLPDAQPPAQGRRRVYGKPAPTPEELRQDEGHPWQSVQVFLGGENRELRVKQLGPLRWRTAGGDVTLLLIVIAPTKYRLTKQGKLLYRKPAYLICTDPEAELGDIIQYYLWRWDIEVNIRDEKTLLGVGEAQVRTPAAVQNVTGTAVAAYAMLLTAAVLGPNNHPVSDHLPAPKWHPSKSHRLTTSRLIQNLRFELWAQSIHFSGFALSRRHNTNPQKNSPHLESALFYAHRYS
jgi:hypothetical protein